MCKAAGSTPSAGVGWGSSVYSAEGHRFTLFQLSRIAISFFKKKDLFLNIYLCVYVCVRVGGCRVWMGVDAVC